MLNVMSQHYKGGPVGVETLAATLNEEVDTIVDVIEPYLLKIGFLNRTPRGRELNTFLQRTYRRIRSPPIQAEQEYLKLS